MRFEFATATKILFGPGTIHDVGPLAREFGKKALVVTGQNVERAQPLLAVLSANGIAATTFPVAGEPQLTTVQNGTAIARSERCDMVIGFGGGSALDAAKAIAGLITNAGDLLDYLEVIGKGKALENPGVPFIAIPTTAGTGTEVTRNAVLASPEHRFKVSLRSPLLLAKLAVIDPELTYNLPPGITATTGLDALTQLIEPFVCSRTNPMMDALCVEGMQRAARSLRRAVETGRDTAARGDMAVASLFGGLALANAGLGAVHGFAAPIGGMFPAPHGAVCAALLPHVMAANLKALRERGSTNPALNRYETVARIVTNNPAASADAGVEWVRNLVADLNVPGLAAYGIRKEHVSELTEKAQAASSMKANPLPLTNEELAQICEAAL